MGDSGAGGTRGRQRALVLVMVVLFAASAVVAGVGTVAADSTAEATAANESNPVKFAYVDTSDGQGLTFVREDGTTVDTGVDNANIIGPMADLDDDGLLEAPYVTDSGDIHAVDKDGESWFVASSAPTSSSKLGVGDWTGDDTPEVLYANSSDNSNIYYANRSGSPTKISSVDAGAVLGAVDFNEDGTRDIVYVGSSQTVKYYDGTDGSRHDVNGVGSDSGLGVGAPADFHQDGPYWAPISDGSSNPAIVKPNQNKQTFDDSSGMSVTPVAGVNWVGNSELEIVHLNGNGKVAYTAADGATGTIENGSLEGKTDPGVAGVISYPGPLSVSDFEANATGDQNVTVNVTTNQTLSKLNVTLSGPENETLTLGDFEQTGSNPYSYTATYDSSTDGKYTATVERAASAGDSVSSVASDTAAVDAVAPVPRSVNLSDATNGDGLVAPGDSIEVTANATGDIGSVTANLSAFDAGSNVSLSHESGDVYNWTGVVGENATDGDQSANVTVSDGQGNTVSNETETLSVDTSELSVELRDNRTVAVDEQVEFSAQSVENASGDVIYEWEFGDGANASGETVNHTYDATGEYVVNLTVTDETDETANASANVTVTEPPTVESATLTDATNGNGVVAPGDTVEVTATVSGDADSVTADLAKFGANGSVELTPESGGTYARAVEVASDATGGEQSVTVAVAGSEPADSAETGALTVDTDELAVSIADSRTVDVGEEVEYAPASVRNVTGDATYQWDFESGGGAVGETVTYAFDSPGEYAVAVTVTDESGDAASDSTTVTVEGSEASEPATTDGSTDGGGVGGSDDPTTGPTAEPTIEPTTTAEPEPTEPTETTAAETTTAPGTTSEEPTRTNGTPGEATAEPTDTSATGGIGASAGEAPGFGPVAALLAVVAAALLALRD